MTRPVQPITLAVVIPVGPSTSIEFLRDTVESVQRYTTPDRRIVLVDDSGEEVCAKLRTIYSEVEVVETGGPSGINGGLYHVLSQGLRYVTERYEARVVLRMDVDALIIGERPEKEAIAYFAKRPRVGILGSYRIDCNGEPRSFTTVGAMIHRRARGSAWWLKNPWGVWLLRRLLARVSWYGYQMGDHCLGGACFYSSECVRRLVDARLLGLPELRALDLPEDVLFGILVKAVGMELDDFATGQRPLGLRWRGLPCPPEELVRRGKKIAHSVKPWEDRSEADIREFFRKHRETTV